MRDENFLEDLHRITEPFRRDPHLVQLIRPFRAVDVELEFNKVRYSRRYQGAGNIKDAGFLVCSALRLPILIAMSPARLTC